MLEPQAGSCAHASDEQRGQIDLRQLPVRRSKPRGHRELALGVGGRRPFDCPTHALKPELEPGVPSDVDHLKFQDTLA